VAAMERAHGRDEDAPPIASPVTHRIRDCSPDFHHSIQIAWRANANLAWPKSSQSAR
jgi:hypothetical protein